MLIVALAGVAVNLVAARILAGNAAGERSLNIEGSYRHILTDLYGFIATAVAAVVILATGFTAPTRSRRWSSPALLLRAAYGLLKASGACSWRRRRRAGPRADRHAAGRPPGGRGGPRPARVGGHLGLPGAVGTRGGGGRRGLPRAAPRSLQAMVGALRPEPHDAAGGPRGGAPAAPADRVVPDRELDSPA